MEFVNIHGQVIDITKGHVKLKKQAKPKPETFHKGWLVTGYSLEQLADARAAHEKEAGNKPFDEAMFMRLNKPHKVQTRPFTCGDAASRCAQLARDAGWKLVQVTPVAKGVA